MENTLSTFNYKKIIQLHIELTNRCNAACPMCVRFFSNSPLLRPDLELGEISLEQFKSWLLPEFLKQIDLILFCGVHGDPCIANDTLEIVEYIIASSPSTKIRFNTNGGMRNPDWWKKLGNLLKDWDEHWVTFSIDGMEDTNHLYRRNVKWNKLMENALAFNSTGAKSVWEFLVFKHNEHQIDDARSLAKKLKFTEFVPKRALGVDNGSELKPMPALNKDGQLDYIIEAPANVEYRNLQNPSGVAEIEFYPFIKEEYNDLKKDNSKFLLTDHENQYKSVYDEIKIQDLSQHDSCSIKCKSKQSAGVEIFIDNYGNVLPCCYIGTRMNGLYADLGTLQLHHEVKAYGYDKLSLKNHSLQEILDFDHLDNIFVKSWTKDSIANGKMLYCSETCGQVSSIDRIYNKYSNNKL